MSYGIYGIRGAELIRIEARSECSLRYWCGWHGCYVFHRRSMQKIWITEKHENNLRSAILVILNLPSSSSHCIISVQDQLTTNPKYRDAPTGPGSQRRTSCAMTFSPCSQNSSAWFVQSSQQSSQHALLLRLLGPNRDYIDLRNRPRLL